MCTVSFVPVNDKYFLTSNRDEKISRKRAVPPQVYKTGNSRLIYPKDREAGGTWIALHENGNAGVLLNGAFQKHISCRPYRLSRGVIFLDVLASQNPLHRFDSLILHHIEPFTLIIIEGYDLYECRWDGYKKYRRQLNTRSHHIWSSVTLYDKEIANKRKQWFEAFLNKNPTPTQDDILHFHQFAGEGDKQNALQMARGENYATVSITSIELKLEQATLIYLDLPEHKMYQHQVEISGPSVVGKQGPASCIVELC